MHGSWSPVGTDQRFAKPLGKFLERHRLPWFGPPGAGRTLERDHSDGVPPPLQSQKGPARVVHESVSLLDNDGNVRQRIQRLEEMIRNWN